MSSVFFKNFYAECAGIQFQGIEPKTVMVGDNVTFSWRYTGDKTPVLVRFNVLKDRDSQYLVYYGFSFNVTPSPFPTNIREYATAAYWFGDVAKNEFAFRLIEVKEFSHGKNFSLHIEYMQTDGKREDSYAKPLLFISGS